MEKDDLRKISVKDAASSEDRALTAQKKRLLEEDLRDIAGCSRKQAETAVSVVFRGDLEKTPQGDPEAKSANTVVTPSEGDAQNEQEIASLITNIIRG